jgi:FMN-dependent dehydrogenase
MSAEDIAAASNGPKWFQLYIPRDRGFAKEMLQRAKEAGYKALIVTADVDVTSNRERSIRLQGTALPNLTMGNVPKTPGGKGNAMDMEGDMAWSDIEFCRQESGLPVIIKSILSPTQALQALRYGCSAVWLSNHGGRQLDNSPSAITTLPNVAAVLEGRVPIIVDGGVSWSRRVPRFGAGRECRRPRPPDPLWLGLGRRPGCASCTHPPEERVDDGDAPRWRTRRQEHHPRIRCSRGRCISLMASVRFSAPIICQGVVIS